MSNRIRIVFFHIGSSVYGGGSKMLLRLLQSLDDEKFEPILLSNTDDELCKRARSHGIETTTVPFRGALNTFERQLLTDARLLIPAGLRILQFNWDSYRVFREADIIWCKNLRAVLTLLPYLSISCSKTIWNVGLGLEPTGKAKYLKSIALRAVDHVFIESEEQSMRIFTERQYRRHSGSFTVFHKGIDTDEFDPARVGATSETNGFRVGTASSLTPRKGIEYLIDALPMIREENDNVMLSIAGEAPEGHEEYKSGLCKKVRQHDIGDEVEFKGWVDDMPEFLSTLDVFVLPSMNEGIPGAVREALAMEVPVVATNVGGTSEAVIPGETGFLVEPGNAEEIAEKVNRLLANQPERTKLGKLGRRHIIENFSIESYVRNYEEFLTEIAGLRGIISYND